jgi:hypothetical protein
MSSPPTFVVNLMRMKQFPTAMEANQTNVSGNTLFIVKSTIYEVLLQSQAVTV